MALGLLNKDKAKNEDLDEDDAIKQHEKFYGGNDDNNSQASSGNVGAAAAMQAAKMFNSGGNEQASGGQNKLIGLAMAQAAQLFDKQQAQGKTVSGLEHLIHTMLTEYRTRELRSRMLLLRLLRWRSSSI
tara:strand:+ start:1991 stop:2380 length:390 start_codon:yes stop_codon:yes gene_type:complete